MRKRAAKRRTVAIALDRTDATPERLAKGDHSEMVNPAEIDSSEQPIGLTRRFRSSHLDRLLRSEAIEWRQWYAGDWYRSAHARSGFNGVSIAGYGERTTAGEISYGLPRTEAQARARQEWREARCIIPRLMVGFIDRLLIHDDMPRYAGRKHTHNLVEIRQTLDIIADHLSLAQSPLDDAGKFEDAAR